MSKTPIDSTDVARKALTGIDGGWYDTYWYGPPADTGRLRLRRVIRQLTSTMTAALARPRGWPVANSLTKISRRLPNSTSRPPSIGRLCRAATEEPVGADGVPTVYTASRHPRIINGRHPA